MIYVVLPLLLSSFQPLLSAHLKEKSNPNHWITSYLLTNVTSSVSSAYMTKFLLVWSFLSFLGYINYIEQWFIVVCSYMYVILWSHGYYPSPLVLTSSLFSNSVPLQLSYFFVVSVVGGEQVCLIMVTFWSMSMLPVATQLQTISVTLPETANYINPRQSWRYVNSCPFYGWMWVIQADNWCRSWTGLTATESFSE